MVHWHETYAAATPRGHSTINADVCVVHDDIGRGNFLAIYLCSGVLGSFASLSYCVLRSGFHVSSLGASGAMAGILGAWCTVNSEYLHSSSSSIETLR